ncbi:tyrosine-type recombinase/integrase [Alicycliphilus sp. T452]
MRDTTLLGPWVRRFLLEHMVGERNLARNTQLNYRDTLKLLLPFAARLLHTPVDRLVVTDLSADLTRRFLADLEESRHCTVSTRNQRLAAIRKLAYFIGEHSPEHIEWCGQVRSIPCKKTSQAVIPYLDKLEMDALLAAPDRQTLVGQRDYVLLLCLYNTGARVSELAQLKIDDLDLQGASVKIQGKGGKQRYCPLWPSTVSELAYLIGDRASQEPVFLNRCGQSITRFGVHTMVERHAMKASLNLPAMRKKRVSPHTIRHTAATHLLRAGVDINTIRGWLGHVSIDTTNIYAEIDLETKAKALAKCAVAEDAQSKRRWRDQPELMAFLRSL